MCVCVCVFKELDGATQCSTGAKCACAQACANPVIREEGDTGGDTEGEAEGKSGGVTGVAVAASGGRPPSWGCC